MVSPEVSARSPRVPASEMVRMARRSAMVGENVAGLWRFRRRPGARVYASAGSGGPDRADLRGGTAQLHLGPQAPPVRGDVGLPGRGRDRRGTGGHPALRPGAPDRLPVRVAGRIHPDGLDRRRLCARGPERLDPWATQVGLGWATPGGGRTPPASAGACSSGSARCLSP